ncbi:hypothetical protein GBF38_003407, partial [Nibea albiflora]
WLECDGHKVILRNNKNIRHNLIHSSQNKHKHEIIENKSKECRRSTGKLSALIARLFDEEMNDPASKDDSAASVRTMYRAVDCIPRGHQISVRDSGDDPGLRDTAIREDENALVKISSHKL